MTGVLLREFRHSPQCCTHIRETCEETEKTPSTQHGVRPQRIQPCPHLDPRLPVSRKKGNKMLLLSRMVCGVRYGTSRLTEWFSQSASYVGTMLSFACRVRKGPVHPFPCGYPSCPSTIELWKEKVKQPLPSFLHQQIRRYTEESWTILSV